jgi:hypothetical protein
MLSLSCAKYESEIHLQEGFWQDVLTNLNGYSI